MGRTSQNRTILLVEDNELIRALVKVSLRPLGCEIVEAADGDEALRILTEIDPDMILLDVVMPGMDGFAVLETVRSRGMCECPIIMLTTAARQADIEHGKDSGADGYIVKPFDKDDLRDTVRRLLG